MKKVTSANIGENTTKSGNIIEKSKKGSRAMEYLKDQRQEAVK
ncbi:MAG: hypothetical protein ABIT23_06490 [Nitrosospira sp.]